VVTVIGRAALQSPRVRVGACSGMGVRMKACLAPRALAASVTAVGITLAAAAVATAAPKNGPVFAFECPGLGTFEVVDAPGQHPFTPAFASHQVFVPYRLTGTTTVGGDVTEFDVIKPATVPSTAITCSFEGTFGAVVIAGTALVAVRGK
jgi:hypothetical protein